MKVSVIMAAHNAAAFIDTAIASALSQTFGDFELIVTDDGSSDATSEIVLRAAASDDRVRLICHEAPKGPGGARNSAIRAARGDWLAPLDSDDEFTPDRLERMVAAAEARGLDLLADNLSLIDFQTREPLGEAFPAEWMDEAGVIDLDWVLKRDWPGQRTPMTFGNSKPIIRRAFLEQARLSYDEAIRCGEDLLLYCEALLSGARFGLLNEPLYVYNIRSDSVSRPKSANTYLARVNSKVRAAVGDSDPSLARTLRRRAHGLQYEIFSDARKRGEILLAVKAIPKMPVRYFAQRIGASALGRVKDG